jgi:hypothetical protein
VLFADGFGALLLLGIWLFCVIDVITTDDARCRNLPKMAWLFIVLLLPEIGSVAWLVAGHPRAGTGAGARGVPKRRAAPSFPEYDRPGRFAATNPEDDEAFLAQVRARAEAQREEYRRRRAAELEAERRRLLEHPDEAG